MFPVGFYKTFHSTVFFPAWSSCYSRLRTWFPSWKPVFHWFYKVFLTLLIKKQGFQWFAGSFIKVCVATRVLYFWAAASLYAFCTTVTQFFTPRGIAKILEIQENTSQNQPFSRHVLVPKNASFGISCEENGPFVLIPWWHN